MEKFDVLNNLSQDWNEIKEIVIYGFGRTAVRNIDKIAEDFQIDMIIDNDPKIHGKQYGNCRVQTFEEVKEKLFGKKIVIATSSIAYMDIAGQLQSIGLKENYDYCRLKDFMAEWYWKNRHQVCLSQTFSSVTSRCTFRCKYCNFFAPYFEEKEQYDYNEEDILRDFEGYFKLVDYVACWSIQGGEPLINKRLPQIIERVYDKFGDRIGVIQVISNGSLIPNKELLSIMKKCKVRMRLSDYTHAIPYEKKLVEVKQCLEDNEIPYDMSIYEQWLDMGMNTCDIPIFSANDNAIRHMQLCSPGCHILNDEKFYFCGQAFAWVKKGLSSLQPWDYIDVSGCVGTIEEKEALLKYCMGFPSKGYLSVCKKCYGMGSDNNRVVKVAEQM